MATHTLGRLDRGILASVQPAAVAALLAAVAITMTILVLWFVPGLDAFAPRSWSQMHANAAVGLLLAAASVLSGSEFSAAQLSPTRAWLAQGAATIVLLMGVLTLVEYVAHVSLGIDVWLPHLTKVEYPGRLSPPAATGFVLLAAILLTHPKAGGRGLWLPNGATMLLIALVLVQICAYLYGALALQGLTKLNIMSPQTVASFSCITFAIVMLRAQRGDFLDVLISKGVGSRIVRLALPAGLLMPLLVFAVEDHIIKAGIVSPPIARATMAAAESFAILCLVVWMGMRINGLEHELRHISLTDELTRVYNRRGFYVVGQQAVLDAIRAKTGLTLFFFDLDGLKKVNDLMGHEAGSDLIRAFATELVARFRKSDIVGRLGGDEFAVLTIREEGIPHEQPLAQLERLASGIDNSGLHTRPLRFSVGHTRLIHGSGDTLDSMVERADALMYLDKGKRQRSDGPREPLSPNQMRPAVLQRTAMEASCHFALFPTFSRRTASCSRPMMR